MTGDRSWMYRLLTSDGFIRDEFVNGVNEFIHFARSTTTYMWDNKIRCPYSRCSNNKFLCEDKVIEHILNRGFIGAYTIWSLHGEHDVGQSSRSRDRIEPYVTNEENEEYGEPIYDEEIENPYSRMVTDAMGPKVSLNYGCENELRFVEEDPNPNASSFYSLLSTTEEPLWSGCPKHTTLLTVLQLLNVKSEYNLSESCFDRLLEIIKNMLPADETLPTDFIE
ncbi:Transposase-associated domain - like 2 [Theobroma cacao]|nr:Transposase-associated domain - like 2 [Theobroma cacao]